MGCSKYSTETECLLWGCHWTARPAGAICKSCNGGETYCNQFTTAIMCTQTENCFWYDGSCHCTPSINPYSFTNATDCVNAGCYWYNGICHSELVGCTEITDFEGCAKSPYCFGFGGIPQVGGCYWYDGACHTVQDPNPGDPAHMLFAGPNYDSATAMMYSNFMNYYIPYAQNKNIWNIHLAMGNIDDVHDNVHMLCKQYDPKGVFQTGHGSQYAITGKQGAVWWCSDPAFWATDAAGKIFYFVSCYTGAYLGPYLVNTWGASAYAGYNDLCYVSSSTHFRESLGEFWKALCDGETVGEAYQSALDKYNYWITQTGSSNLIWNRDHFIMAGDPYDSLYTLTPSEICNWVTAKGGATTLTITDIMELINSYLTSTPPVGYSFIPTVKEIFGAVDYWFGFIISGNQKTGCSF